jgi:hypothetical protein
VKKRQESTSLKLYLDGNQKEMCKQVKKFEFVNCIIQWLHMYNYDIMCYQTCYRINVSFILSTSDTASVLKLVHAGVMRFH